MENNTTKSKLDELLEFEDDLSFPPGWQQLIKDFKKKAKREDGGSHILFLEEQFGSLECTCQLSSYSDQVFMIDMHNFRRKSHRTCFGCGSPNGHRSVINGQVEVYCDFCKVKVIKMDKENNKTNTWLDNF
jgi:hypothetical protein